jgi:hypothetical protein
MNWPVLGRSRLTLWEPRDRLAPLEKRFSEISEIPGWYAEPQPGGELWSPIQARSSRHRSNEPKGGNNDQTR